jgi:hypothetical protein
MILYSMVKMIFGHCIRCTVISSSRLAICDSFALFSQCPLPCPIAQTFLVSSPLQVIPARHSPQDRATSQVPREPAAPKSRVALTSL